MKKVEEYIDVYPISWGWGAYCMGVVSGVFNTEADALRWCIKEIFKYVVIPEEGGDEAE